MKGKRDLWKEIENLPEGEQPKEHLLDDLLADVPAAPRAAGETVALARSRGGMITAVFMGLVLLAIFFSIYFVTETNMRDEIRYFDSTQITFEELSSDDFAAFIQENDLQVSYFPDNVGDNSVAYTVEEHQLVYLKQQCLFISLIGFDQINLGIVLTNDEFEEFEPFNLISSETQIKGIDVVYGITPINDTYNIKAKFVQDGITYYLEITSFSDQGVLENYVSLLLGL